MTSTGAFALNPRLAADSHLLGRLSLCQVRLMDEAAYPWLILVPEREGLREISDLAAADRALLIEEIAAAGKALESLFRPDKINVGVLGNVVAQLHVHVVARRKDDPAWPGPVWGHAPPRPHAPDQLAERRAELRRALRLDAGSKFGL